MSSFGMKLRRHESKQLRSEAAKQLSFLPEISLPSCLLAPSPKSAFTLAETLIVLAIIGVIAALIIPNFVQNYKKRVTVEKLKTAYSIFTQAVVSSVNDNGPISGWQYTNSMELGDKYLVPYLKGLKKADKYSPMRTLSVGEGIVGGAANTSYLTWPRGAVSMLSDPIYLMPNGMLVHFAKAHNAGADYAHIIVDINGYQNPNIMGIDGFRFSLIERTSSLIPTGAEPPGDKKYLGYDDCVRDDRWAYYRGGACAGLIAKNGWRITDDYPWGNGGLTKKESE